jgi:hypothetical protein
MFWGGCGEAWSGVLGPRGDCFLRREKVLGCIDGTQ